MIIARFEFLPDYADQFCEDGQSICEMQFSDLVEMVAFTKDVEHCLTEVLVNDGANIISLREVSESADAP